MGRDLHSEFIGVRMASVTSPPMGKPYDRSRQTMANYDSPPSDPDSDVQPSDTLPDGYRVIRLPARELRFPVAPVPMEEDEPADKRKRQFLDHPINRRSSTSVDGPIFHYGVPIKYLPHTYP